jgi:predicted Fe-Mo cluster-binding NifX family protein
MERWINMPENNCDPSREDEFNDWYNNMHLPDCLETPGFLAVRRYVNKELRDGRGKYLAIYEIETDDIDKTMEIRREKRMAEGKQGRLSNLGIQVWLDVLYKQIAEKSVQKKIKKMERWINMVESYCDPSREDEFNDWYNNMHLPDCLETPGFLAVRRYVNKELRDGRGKYLAIYEIETDDIDKTMEIRREKRMAEGKQGRLSNLGIQVWRDVLYKQIAERFAHKK